MSKATEDEDDETAFESVSQFIITMVTDCIVVY